MAHHSVMEIINVVDWDALRPLLTQLLCIPALIIASQRSLGLFIAISTLTPAPPISEGLTSSRDSVTTPLMDGGTAPPARRSLRKRFFGHRVISVIFGVSMFASVEALAIYGLYKIDSQVVRDGLFAVIWAVSMALVINAASYQLWPVEETVSYRRLPKTGSLKLETKKSGNSGKRRALFSSLFSLLVLGTSYAEFSILQPFVSASLVLSFVSVFRHKRLRMKRVVQFLLAYELALPVIFGIIMLVKLYFDSRIPDVTSIPSSDAPGSLTVDSNIVSDWIMSLKETFQQSFHIIAPGVVMAMTLRLDSALYMNTSHLRQILAPGVMSGRISGFPAPLFSTAVVALLLSVIGVHVLPLMYPSFDLQALGLFVYMPVVIGSIALKAWAMGLLRVWWDYEETWFADDDKATEGTVIEGAEVYDVEKALDVKA